jgi:hypothetical protein
LHKRKIPTYRYGPSELAQDLETLKRLGGLSLSIVVSDTSPVLAPERRAEAILIEESQGR